MCFCNVCGAELDGQPQVGATRRHVATIRRVRGRQHARPKRQHVRPDGRLGVAQRPVPPTPRRPESGPVARPLVALVARAVAHAVDAAPGPMATLDCGHETQVRRRLAVFCRLSRYKAVWNEINRTNLTDTRHTRVLTYR